MNKTAPTYTVEIHFADHTYTATVRQAGQLETFLRAKGQQFTIGTVAGGWWDGFNREMQSLANYSHTLRLAALDAKLDHELAISRAR